MKIRRYQIVFAAAALFMMIAIEGCGFGGTEGPKLVIKTDKGDVDYALEIADTYESRKNGLMFRTGLTERNGMLFVFEKPQVLNFWMKNTLIPLDMIFLDPNYKIIHVEKNVQPCKTDPCAIYNSGRKGLYTLEVNAGESDKFDIKEGDGAELIK